MCSSYFAAGEQPVVEHLRKEELINCTCGFMEEDGLMIQVMYCTASVLVQMPLSVGVRDLGWITVGYNV
jgi:hypothetical protein